MNKDLDASQPLTMRERIALAVMLAIVKIVRPSGWQHEVNAMTAQIEKEVGFKNV